MNVNYHVGRAAFGVRDRLLRLRPPLVARSFPYGIQPCYDLVRFAGASPIRTILDIGANDGGTSLAYASWFHGASIYAFEPIAATYRELVERTKHVSGIRTYHQACGESPGEVVVRLRGHSTINTLLDTESAKVDAGKSGGELAGTTETIQVTTVDEFCTREGLHQIDLLKSDTEGFDLQVLAGAKETLRTRGVRFVYVEVGFHGQTAQTPFADVSRFLADEGFLLSGFYEPMRRPEKKHLPFCNALFSH